MKQKSARTLPLLALTVSGCVLLPRLDCTKGTSSICEVHQLSMTRTSVPIIYGLTTWTYDGKVRNEASKGAFPHADKSVSGGCVSNLTSPRRAIIYVCPDCKRAADEWQRKHETDVLKGPPSQDVQAWLAMLDSYTI